MIFNQYYYKISFFSVLKYLADVRIVSTTLPSPGQGHGSDLKDEPLEFCIEFHFSLNNPYFENRILTKEYFLKCEPGIYETS